MLRYPHPPGAGGANHSLRWATDSVAFTLAPADGDVSTVLGDHLADLGARTAQPE